MEPDTALVLRRYSMSQRPAPACSRIDPLQPLRGGIAFLRLIPALQESRAQPALLALPFRHNDRQTTNSLGDSKFGAHRTVGTLHECAVGETPGQLATLVWRPRINLGYQGHGFGGGDNLARQLRHDILIGRLHYQRSLRPHIEFVSK
jgi:hypothetical protein